MKIKQILRISSGLANLLLKKFACQEMTLEKVTAGKERDVKTIISIARSGFLQM